MENITKDNYQKIFRILGIIVFSGIILYFGKPLLIPLSFAMFISLILQPVCAKMESKGINRVVAIFLGLIAVVSLVGLLLFLLYTQFAKFISEWPAISVKIGELITGLKSLLTERFGVSQVQADLMFTDLMNSSAKSALTLLQTSIVSGIVGLVMLLLIPIYAFLILFYRQLLVDVLYSMFPQNSRAKVAEVITLSINTYYDFIKGMAVVYFVVGLLNSIGLLLLGIPHAFLFGFMTAIMTFIPYVGIIVASLLPISYAWMTYNSIWYPLGVIGIFTFVQYLEANIIFPWAVSQRLQLNTLLTLAVIVIGGIFWGGAGMILFIPFAAILKLIADRMEGWETIAKILGT